MSDLHWNLRKHLSEFRPDGRLFVLMSIYLHKNTRNRSWPSNDLIAEETGLSRAPISKSIEWLVNNFAVILVPYDKRIGDEKDLPNRKNIYQLTGVIKLAGRFRPYMYLTPEGWAGVIQEIKDLGNSSNSELLNEINSLQNESSQGEHSIGEPKGITGIKGNKKDAAPKERSRQPKPLFDLVAKRSFGIADTSKLDKQSGARIGKIYSWLTKRGATEENATAFYVWYGRETDNASAPRDVDKFAEWYIKFEETLKNKVIRDDGYIPVAERTSVLDGVKLA